MDLTHTCIQCLIVALALGLDNNNTRPTNRLCTIAKPLVWHRDEDANSTALQRSGRKLRFKTKDGTTKVKDINGGVARIVKRLLG